MQVPTEPYRLQPLSGLVISATNFSGRGERELLQQQIEAAGATYSAEMHKGVCSHLICKFAKGEKYRSAVPDDQQAATDTWQQIASSGNSFEFVIHVRGVLLVEAQITSVQVVKDQHFNLSITSAKQVIN